MTEEVFFHDSRGQFTVRQDGSVVHHHGDGGSRTEFPGSIAATAMIALGKLEMTEEERGRKARSILAAYTSDRAEHRRRSDGFSVEFPEVEAVADVIAEKMFVRAGGNPGANTVNTGRTELLSPASQRRYR